MVSDEIRSQISAKVSRLLWPIYRFKISTSARKKTFVKMVNVEILMAASGVDVIPVSNQVKTELSALVRRTIIRKFPKRYQMCDSISVTPQSNLACAFKLKRRHHLSPFVMMSVVVLVTELVGAQTLVFDENTAVLSAKHARWLELMSSINSVPQVLATIKTATSSTIVMCSRILARYFAIF